MTEAINEKELTIESIPVWFSHRQDRYEAELREGKRIFSWAKKPEMWDWRNCTISALKKDDKTKIIVRSAKTIYSKYKKTEVDVKFMLGFDAVNIYEPKDGIYNEPPQKNTKNRASGPPKRRWVMQLDDDYFIWEWVKDGIKKEESNVYRIFEMINGLTDDSTHDESVFEVKALRDDRIIPVVYQPAIDSWDNFVREVHCHKSSENEIEVTLMFNNEELRKHAVLNSIYEWFRSWFYGRTIDIESFKIILKGEPESFNFKGIYSDEYGIKEDDKHGDKPDDGGNVPNRKILYYFDDTKHPIIFINTSNHAMAEHDTNNKLWKWEYIPWVNKSPVKYGKKSRAQIERSFKPKLKFRLK